MRIEQKHQLLATNVKNYYLDCPDRIAITYPDIPDDETEPLQIEDHALFKLLESINARKATYSEDLPSWVSKNDLAVLCKLVQDVIHTIPKTSNIPQQSKRAEVAPIKEAAHLKIYKDYFPPLKTSARWLKKS